MAGVREDLIDDWVAGWIVSRRAQLVASFPDAHLIEVGSAAESGRFVLRTTDVESLRSRVESVDRDRFWVKGPRPPEEASSPFTDHWTVDDRLHLMTSPLAARGIGSLPDGYRLEVTDEGDALESRILGADGSVAARGRVGLTPGAAVPDQIVTAPNHRRRGLARAIMQSLIDGAAERGVTHGVLLASFEGVPLYESLGWASAVPFVQAEYRRA